MSGSGPVDAGLKVDKGSPSGSGGEEMKFSQ